MPSELHCALGLTVYFDRTVPTDFQCTVPASLILDFFKVSVV